jgi:FixJ family two-component response regulator
VPAIKVVGMSMHSMPAYARRMIQSGASGYVTKNSSKEELFTALVEVQKGNKYICEEVKNILAHQELDENADSGPDLNALSRRELDVVQLIKEGLSSKEIAQKLDLSLKTVEEHSGIGQFHQFTRTLKRTRRSRNELGKNLLRFDLQVVRVVAANTFFDHQQLWRFMGYPEPFRNRL